MVLELDGELPLRGKWIMWLEELSRESLCSPVQSIRKSEHWTQGWIRLVNGPLAVPVPVVSVEIPCKGDVVERVVVFEKVFHSPFLRDVDVYEFQLLILDEESD